MLNNLEKGDIVAIRNVDGATCSVTVLSVKIDYERPGAFVRFDYINYTEPSPMRRTAYPKELVSIIRKANVKVLDPKQPRPGDGAIKGTQKAVIIDGKVYVEKTPETQGAVPVNAEVKAQVHEAVKSPAKPVTSRIKKSTEEVKK